MSDTTIVLIIAGTYIVIAFLTIFIWIFINPEDYLCEICGCGLLWPVALLLLIIFVPFKLLEMLQDKLRERKYKKKYYDENEYQSENEDWYSEE